MKRKYFVLKLLIMLFGFLLYGVGFYGLYKMKQTLDVTLAVLSIIPILIGGYLEVYAFLVLDPTNRIDLRTCPSGTLVKIFNPFLFKLRHFRYDFVASYFYGNKLELLGFLVINSDLKRVAVKDKGIFYRIFDFQDVGDLVFHEQSDDGRCLSLSITLSLNSEDIPQFEMNFVQKPIKMDGRDYYRIKDIIKQLFDRLHKRM